MQSFKQTPNMFFMKRQMNYYLKFKSTRNSFYSSDFCHIVYWLWLWVNNV